MNPNQNNLNGTEKKHTANLQVVLIELICSLQKVERLPTQLKITNGLKLI